MRISDWRSDVCASDLYFPNKSAIVAMLYERYEEDALEIVRHHCSAIENENDVFAAVDAMINAYYQAVKDVPATQDLINAIQADKELANLDIAGSRAPSRIFLDLHPGRSEWRPGGKEG